MGVTQPFSLLTGSEEDADDDTHGSDDKSGHGEAEAPVVVHEGARDHRPDDVPDGRVRVPDPHDEPASEQKYNRFKQQVREWVCSRIYDCVWWANPLSARAFSVVFCLAEP